MGNELDRAVRDIWYEVMEADTKGKFNTKGVRIRQINVQNTHKLTLKWLEIYP